MKKIVCLQFIIICLMMGCNMSKTQQTSGIQLENLDTTAIPGNDFYRYACGGWMKKNPLTGEHSRFGAFDKLGEDNRTQLKDLIVEIASATHEQGSIPQKIGTLYNMAMDSVKLNADGTKPVLPDLELIRRLKNKDELPELLAQLQLLNIDVFWDLSVDADLMQSEANLFQLSQGGLGLDDREYYLEKDEHTVFIREKYKEHVSKMFLLFGFTPLEAAQAQQAVMNIETKLAEAAYPKEKLRDPYANYHKMSYDSLKITYASFNWDVYFNRLGVNLQTLSVSEPEAISKALSIIHDAPSDEISYYLQWRLIDNAAAYLNDEVRKQNFEFYGKILSGATEMRPRWKSAVDVVNGSLGEALGQVYVAKYFPPEAKKRMLTLVENLKVSFAERIDALTWMSNETKKKAHEKLLAMRAKVGYPDKWKDYSPLEIKTDSYWENVKRVNRFLANDNLSKIKKPVDKEEWYMSPQTVNAYYNHTGNEICFPAAILQYPFFDMQADDAFNYGAIGTVIGHEMTHGFDDQGRQFDKDGNLRNWWTNEDAENFKKRTQVMIDFFDRIEVAPGVHANGTFTLGENIADLGGTEISYQAYRNATKEAPLPMKDGFTPEQRFFLAHAAVWAGNIREAETLRLTKGDSHSLFEWRVNGIMPQIDSWYNAFNVTPKDSLYVAPEKRVSIW